MKIETIVVGFLDTNCYIIEKDNEVIVIDPGDEAERIISHIGNRKVVGIISTHSHSDHIMALDDLLKKYKVNYYNMSNLSEGEIRIGSFMFDVIYTKGHLDDSITLYFKDENTMFTGDFIFKSTIGRFDLPGANPEDMKKSINKILKYPANTILYPGHGDKTILKDELDMLKYYSNIL